jgi:phosphoribosylaminoimidazolecarboxamide formyltransferase/IMP cyclohydrolase
MNAKALISVSDKTNLEQLLTFLKSKNYQIISTGGTAKFIKELGYEVTEVHEITNFPEMLGGRVKTLHPNILGAILARREEEQDLEELKSHEIETIDLVVVNLYPFAKTIKQENLVFEDAIENIDIGGPTLLRSAAKNYKSITVLSKPNQYKAFIETASKFENDSKEILALREKLAIAVFEQVSNYDNIIHHFLKNKLTKTPLGASFELSESISSDDALPETINLELKKRQSLRYGENPQQKAALYVDETQPYASLVDYKCLQGKEISFNNLLDIQAAWNIVTEYDSSVPCSAIIKHNNPCGVAIAPNAALAFTEALSTDTISAFGGIVAFNITVDLATATELTQIFLECIVAPEFTDEALEMLAQKKNLRLVTANLPAAPIKHYDIKSFAGAYLLQESNDELLDKSKMKTVTTKQVEDHQWIDLIFAWKIVKHVKSNAVVAVKNGKTIGIGCGQTNRVKAVEDCLRNMDLDTRDAVLASDAFFPFADNIHLAAQNHISVIIQPGGSIKDQEVIDACNEAGMAMVFTGLRHFKH